MSPLRFLVFFHVESFKVRRWHRSMKWHRNARVFTHSRRKNYCSEECTSVSVCVCLCVCLGLHVSVSLTSGTLATRKWYLREVRGLLLFGFYMLLLKRGLAQEPSALPVAHQRPVENQRQKKPRTVNHMFARQWNTESAAAEDDIEEMVSYESTFCHWIQLFFMWHSLGMTWPKVCL